MTSINERLLKGTFILSALVEVGLFVACMNSRMTGGEYGMAAVAIVTALLALDKRDAP
jgi:hypothetical protein